MRKLVTLTAVAGAVAAAAVGLSSPATAAPVNHYTAARADWTAGAHVAAAAQARYWLAARRQLAAAGRYGHERHDLSTLVSIPLTNTTAGQRATEARVIRELDGFFHTPGRYGIPAGNARRYARADWIEAAHVVAAREDAWLGAALDELDTYRTRYPAARADLASLESLPLTGLTAKQRATARRDIKALDAFFRTPDLPA